MKIAIIGSGGREHAIYWKLCKSTKEDDVFVLPGNGGIKNSINIDISNFNDIEKFCKEKNIELIIVGPEAPLANGIVDYFNNSRIKVFGPSKNASILESSKVFAKKFMTKYGVSTADYWLFDNIEQAQDLIDKAETGLVIKYSGLAGGKGVYVCQHPEQSQEALNDIIKKYGEEAEFLIEEKLEGSEMSIIGFTDGETIKILTPSQDHKQAYDLDKGPNTGGMGAYTPVEFYHNALEEKILNEIIKPTMKGIKDERFDYKGVIYFGLMITKDGPKLLEYNIRLGDPETEVILPALKSDFLDLILSCFDGSLNDFKIEFNSGYYVDVVLTSGGYPGEYNKGYLIKGIDDLDNNTLVFHAGTKKENGDIITNGGRVLNIVAHGESLNSAVNKVYKECKKLHFDNMHYRKDIGKRGM
jgi:phosphoribosylamine--glycine ligase